jgi:hypothetical protein
MRNISPLFWRCTIFFTEAHKSLHLKHNFLHRSAQISSPEAQFSSPKILQGTDFSYIVAP